jgi:hypothetical protein
MNLAPNVILSNFSTPTPLPLQPLQPTTTGPTTGPTTIPSTTPTTTPIAQHPTHNTQHSNNAQIANISKKHVANIKTDTAKIMYGKKTFVHENVRNLLQEDRER